MGGTAMNDAGSIQLTDITIDKTSSVYCSVAGRASGTACAITPVNRRKVETRLERLQRYAAHLEVLLLHKNREVNELHGIMDSRVEEVRQKQIEHERVMIHQARHAATGEMLGTIAHQWRQPLHTISLVVQNMKDAWEYGEFNGELLDRSIFQAMEQVMYLSRTIDDFRTFLNPAKTTEYFNPIQCVEECVGLLSGRFSTFPDIEVKKADLSEENIRIAGCQNAFKQVIFNMLNNANDAIQDQQRRIGPAFRGQITIEIQCRDDAAVIGVSDNGGGIAESTMEHIFEPYFTTKDKANGIGIGLYISRLIIENSMNGSLWAKNIGDGAFFGIRLPVVIFDGVSV
jgi:signal transduction histidine kinase